MCYYETEINCFNLFTKKVIQLNHLCRFIRTVHVQLINLHRRGWVAFNKNSFTFSLCIGCDVLIPEMCVSKIAWNTPIPQYSSASIDRSDCVSIWLASIGRVYCALNARNNNSTVMNGKNCSFIVFLFTWFSAPVNMLIYIILSSINERKKKKNNSKTKHTKKGEKTHTEKKKTETLISFRVRRKNKTKRIY